MATDTDWMDDGSCRGAPSELFHPDTHGEGSSGIVESYNKAKRLYCNSCPVRAQCLEYALETRQNHGLWGGETERERRRILKRRAAPVAA